MTFGKTGESKLAIGGIYAENQIAGDYLIGLDTYDANYSQRLDQVVRHDHSPGRRPRVRSARTSRR